MQTPRKVLITGAGGALGQAVVSRFVAASDRVTAVASPGRIPSDRPKVEWLEIDLSQREQTSEKLKDQEFDVVVHCVGGFRWSLAEEISSEDFQFLMETNFSTAFHVAQAVLPAMKKKKTGTLLFVSSIATQVPATGMAPYAASKGALNAFVVNLAAELKSSGIRVNAVLPSMLDTPANRRDMPDGKFGDWIPTAELAETLFHLSQSLSITGALLPIAGRG